MKATKVTAAEMEAISVPGRWERGRLVVSREARTPGRWWLQYGIGGVIMAKSAARAAFYANRAIREEEKAEADLRAHDARPADPVTDETPDVDKLY